MQSATGWRQALRRPHERPGAQLHDVPDSNNLSPTLSKRNGPRRLVLRPDWYVDDFSARLKPAAKRILMNTRWHEEDVAGRVLDQIERKLIKGRVISIPAIAEENDP